MSTQRKQKPVTMTMDAETLAVLREGAKVKRMTVSAYVRYLAWAANPKPDPIFCVECGAAKALDCICDDMNHDQHEVGDHNTI